jgi:hypothetical protein
MTLLHHSALRLAALVACVALAAGHVAAQSVLLRVSSSDTSEPLHGALAYLLDDAGRAVRTVLTDERGRALFVTVPPARYRVRAEMIGMATRDTDAFEVSQGATDLGEILLDPRPIDLGSIDVTAERRRCTSRPAGEGLLVATLWEEARKALSAAELTERQGLYRYETVTYERDVTPDRRMVTREDESRREGFMRSPFESLPPEDFAQHGFVRRDGPELVYYAPDARALLSESFLDTHCFRVVSADESSDVIGLGFEPLGGRGRTADISGTLWLSEQSAELRWLEYLYTNLDLPVASATAGGRVEFQRMESGTWIIPEWWIEMPILGMRILDDGTSRPALRGLRRSGGRVVAVHEGGGRALTGRRQTGGIEGIVVDSAGVPLAGVRVGVLGGSQEVFTDENGQYGLLGLGGGTQQVRFVAPDLSAVGLVPPLVDREVIAGEVSYLEYHMPSVADMLLEVCAAQPLEPGTGVLLGRVTDDAGAGWPGATVRVVWSDRQVLDASVQTRVYFQERGGGREVTTEADGTYRVCGVPRAEALTLSTLVDGSERAAGSATIGVDDVGLVREIRRPR